MADDQDAGSLKHDPWLMPAGAALIALADAVFADTERHRPHGSRSPRADAIERRREVIGNILANLAVCTLLKGPEGRLAIATEHGVVTRYDRSSLPRQVIAQCTFALERIDLVFRYPGSRGNTVTTLEPTERLLGLMQQHRVTLADISRASGAETIILKAPDPKRPGHNRPIDYADTTKTRRMRAAVERINRYINSAQVTVEGRAQLPVHLERQFLTTTPEAPQRYDVHGRLYGGWWITMPRAERHRIRINGEQCVDLDFRALVTCLAYARAGAQLPEGDPYAGLAGIEQPSPEQRQAIKQGLNALYFRSGPMGRLPEDVKAVLGPDWTASRFMAAVCERHAPIAHLFGKGIGLSLLYTESAIMVQTLLALIDLGVVALPIHDGLMCRTSDMAVALDTLRDTSQAIVGVALPVQEKPLRQLNSPHMVPSPPGRGQKAAPAHSDHGVGCPR